MAATRKARADTMYNKYKRISTGFRGVRQPESDGGVRSVASYQSPVARLVV